jgi:primary-amine oxidase
MGWSFFLSWRRETGLAFWNVNFRDSEVLYEMSLQEASASYSMASDPGGMNSQLLDRYWGLGAASTELMEGYDCPQGATFLSSNFYLGERSYRAVRNVCIFEMDLGRAMSRHNDRATIRSTKGVAMVVRWMATVGKCCIISRAVGRSSSLRLILFTTGNYDYQIDAIFHPSGSIELEVRASGFLLARYWDIESHGAYGRPGFLQVVPVVIG